VTTNEERSLPDAFLRRCIVHQMRLPRDRQSLFEWLFRRGRAHFPKLDDEVLNQAAEMLWEDRKRFLDLRLAAPGGAEYLDLLRIVHERGEDLDEQMKLLEIVGDFVLKKHPQERRD
ncbi:MAG: AAA family ATPase, partial [Acidobacteriota bacterium]|nr:AAA family ATPase [Acidobacteriota bacterium]